MRPLISFTKFPPRIFFPILFFSLLFFIMSSSVSQAKDLSPSDKKLDPVVLQLKWFHQFQFAGYYAALHKGFFKEEGLDVTIKAGGPKVKVDEEVSSGRANFGILASELIQKKAQGQPLVLLAVIMQHSIRAIIVRADSGINSPSDLIDKRMMINRNEETEFMAMFAAEGVPVNKLNIISKDKTANNQFIDGKIDALNGSIANQPFLFQGKNIPVKTIRPISYGIDFYGDSLFTSETELKKHPHRVEAFRKATLRGWEYAMEHSSEIIDLIIAEYNPLKTRAHLQFEAKTIDKLILPELVDIGHVNPHRIERIAQVYAERNVIPRDFSLKGFIYDPSPGFDTRLIRQLITGFFVIVVMVFLCVGFLVFFNARLKKRVLQRTAELSKANQNLLEEVLKRKNKEELLKLNANILNKSQEIAHLGSWHLDIKKNILTWSDETFRIFGLIPQEVEATYEAFLTAIHPDDREMVDKTYNNAIENKLPYKCIHRIIRHDGEVRTVLEKSEAVVDEKGETIHSFGFTQDITEQVITSENLRKSKEEWEKTFDAMSDIVTIQETDLSIIKVNQAACAALGLSSDEILGQHCHELFHGSKEPCQHCPLLKTRETFEPCVMEMHHEKLGKTFLVSASPVFDEQGELEYLAHVAKDITEQKRLEEELFQAHKMEAIGTLAGGIAHDFNNILSAIIGFSKLAQHNIPQNNPAEKDLDLVIKSCRRAADLVQQILTFSRKSEHHLQSLNPHLMVKEALRLLSSSLPSTLILQEDIDKGCGKIWADPTNIHQIMMNLCTNALHAMEDEKGTLTVRLYRREIAAEEIVYESGVSAGPFVVLSVSDTGCGMDEATKERIFEPYFTTKEMDKGTGLGLAVVHGIIQDYKGFIRVESTPVEGSTFSVYIPALQGEAASPEDSASKESKQEAPLLTGNERILVVDDELLLVQIHKKQLEGCGYTVTITTESRDALEKIRAQPEQFDVLITDQTMPRLSGVALAKAVMKIRPDMPIILCTGYSDVVSKEEALSMGIKRYVSKPIYGDELLLAVRDVLDERIEEKGGRTKPTG